MHKPHLPRHRAPIVPALATGAFLALAFGAGLLLPLYSAAPSFHLIAQTRSGDVRLAGAGSTCREAARNAVIPHDWTRITCERSRFSAR